MLPLKGARPDGAPYRVVERIAEHRGNDQRDRESGALNVPEVSTAASAPTANSSESPGRNGVTTKPVSAKMIVNRIA